MYKKSTVPIPQFALLDGRIQCFPGKFGKPLFNGSRGCPCLLGCFNIRQLKRKAVK